MGDRIEPTTVDAVCRGELMLRQPRDGYRFNVDAVVLACFARQTAVAPPRRVVDLGAGCGVIGLLLARSWPAASVLLVEIQPELAMLAQENAAENKLADRVEVRCVDLRETHRWADLQPDLVVTNPPFFRLETGRVSPSAQRSLAKHEVACTLDELLAACAAGMSDAGRVTMIHAADRRAEIEAGMARHGLAIEHLRPVVPFPGRPPARLLASGRRGGVERQDLDPLVIEERPGAFTEELRQMVELGPGGG
jgi:tRNA1Val (adenine37-N6)-methyltransferase